MTDANAGLASISWAIGDTNGKLANIMSSSVSERRKLVQNGATRAEIEASKDAEMSSVFNLFNALLEVGPAPATLNHFVRCVAMGLTKGPEIQNCFSTNGTDLVPLLLQADWSKGLVLYSKQFEPSEVVNISSIERTNRAQIVLKGSISGRRAVLYPHHRNGWHGPNGVKYAADNWVSTGSFQVWID